VGRAAGAGAVGFAFLLAAYCLPLPSSGRRDATSCLNAQATSTYHGEEGFMFNMKRLVAAAEGGGTL